MRFPLRKQIPSLSWKRWNQSPSLSLPKWPHRRLMQLCLTQMRRLPWQSQHSHLQNLWLHIRQTTKFTNSQNSSWRRNWLLSTSPSKHCWKLWVLQRTMSSKSMTWVRQQEFCPTRLNMLRTKQRQWLRWLPSRSRGQWAPNLPSLQRLQIQNLCRRRKSRKSRRWNPELSYVLVTLVLQLKQLQIQFKYPKHRKYRKYPALLQLFGPKRCQQLSKKAEDVVDVHPQLSQVALIQQQHRGVDFTKSPETSDSENSEPEISISEPFQALEQEDQRETQRLRDLDRHLRVKARRKVSEAASPAVKFLGTTGSIGSRFGASTASTWAKLEAEDQKIEDKILDLDDPRRPVDLRQYQQLNNMQDESMAELEGEAKMRR